VEPVACRVRFHVRFAYWVYTAFLALRSGFAAVVVVLCGWWGAIWAVPSPLRSDGPAQMAREGLGLSGGGGHAEGMGRGPGQNNQQQNGKPGKASLRRHPLAVAGEI